MKNISNICENLYASCLKQIPQFENGELLWILNGSVLCNILANVETINDSQITDSLRSKLINFVRTPKGDIDICYKPGRKYKFDLNSNEVLEFYSISDEQRTYNFVDSNSELTEDDLNQLCKYKTVNGLEFYAKMPQYIFLYKFREYVTMFHQEILNNELDRIVLKRKNIIDDNKKLYEISCEYYGSKNLLKLLIDKLKDISDFFHELYENDKIHYNDIIQISLSEIQKNNKPKLK